jgi:hypothetical protein
MVAVRVGNDTPVKDELDSAVARIECLFSVYFHHYCQMLSHCLLGVVVSQTGHPVELYLLSSVEIRW